MAAPWRWTWAVLMMGVASLPRMVAERLPHSAPPGAELTDDLWFLAEEVTAANLQFLQADVRLRSSSASQEMPFNLRAGDLDSSGSLEYARDLYWAPDRPSDLNRTESGCQMLPDVNLAVDVKTAFAMQECPRILYSASQRLLLGLETQTDGTNAPGYNPSVVPLPASLQTRFASGRWLAAIRAGDEHYGYSICHHPAIAMSQDAASAIPSGNMLYWTVHHNAQWLEWAIQKQAKTFKWNPRTYIAVLDENFKVISKAAVTMRNGDGVWDDAAIQDMRVKELSDGKLLVGFQPYYLSMAEPGRDSSLDWRLQECVAFLHLDTSNPDGELAAWVDRHETRVLQDCPGAARRAPGPKKNLGFFERDSRVYALDWAYPTRIGELDLAALDASRSNRSEHISRLCFGYEGQLESPPRSPWEGLQTWGRHGVEQVELHNGAPLVWIEELGEWLGIGHTIRRLRHKVSGKRPVHYLHQFFTVNGGSPMQQPFSMIRASGEFCFGNPKHPGVCESVQMATSLLRVGDRLQVGYGVMDCESFIAYYDLKDILAMLRELQHEG